MSTKDLETSKNRHDTFSPRKKEFRFKYKAYSEELETFNKRYNSFSLCKRAFRSKYKAYSKEPKMSR